jgi:hypothetical protein
MDVIQRIIRKVVQNIAMYILSDREPSVLESAIVVGAIILRMCGVV